MKRPCWLLMICFALTLSVWADAPSATLERTRHHVHHHQAHRAAKHHAPHRARYGA